MNEQEFFDTLKNDHKLPLLPPNDHSTLKNEQEFYDTLDNDHKFPLLSFIFKKEHRPQPTERTLRSPILCYLPQLPLRPHIIHPGP